MQRVFRHDRRGTAFTSLVIAVLVLGVTTLASASPNDRLNLSWDTDGAWILDGFILRDQDPLVLTLERAPGHVRKIPVEQISDRLYLVDDQDRVAGFLSAPPPSLLREGSLARPMSVVIDWEEEQYILAWPPVPGASEYQVAINAHEPRSIGNVTTTRVAFRDARVLDYVTISAFTSESDDRGTQLADLVFFISDYSTHGSDLVSTSLESSSVEVSTTALPSQTVFTFTTFIPEQYVEAPLLCGGAWPFPNANYFRGDNRSWSYSSPAFRTRQMAFLNWSSTDSISRWIGQTRRYQKNANGTYTFLDGQTASLSSLTHLGPNTLSSTQMSFYMQSTAQNPYCPGPIGRIDYVINAVVNRTAGLTGDTFVVWGRHDRFPNYEFYYSDSTTAPTTHRFRSWVHGSPLCLDGCTMVEFNIVK